MTPIRTAAIAGLTGFAVMSLELAAIRLLAPHFGDSAYVWTNVIGVMLVALAFGAFIGGRLADRERGIARLSRLLLAAGILAALIPLVAGPLGAWLLPADLALDAAMGALVRGSLATTLLIFAPPVLAAGAVTPMLVAELAAREHPVGRASGLVAAASTIGSLGGTFATTHLLVPGIGSRGTIWLCAGLLLACGVLCRPGLRAGLLLLLPVLLPVVPLGPMRAVQDGATLLAEVESPYQYLQVVDERDGVTGAGVRSLKINEGLDSFHSIRVEGSAYTGGRYYDYHAVAPFLAGAGARPSGLRVLSLGAAAGTFERVLEAAHPGVQVDSVEIDPAVVELGREFFDAFRTTGRVFSGLDARVFVEQSTETYHVVLVDAYERQIYIPAHVASRQFFAAVADRLEPGGVVSVNAGGRTFDDPVVVVIAHTMAAEFGHAHAFRVPGSRNFMIVARKDRDLDPAVLLGVEADSDELRAVLDAMARPGAWRTFEAEEPILVDDRPFLDLLQEDALSRRLGQEGLLSIDGDREPDAVEQAAYLASQRHDWEGLVESVRTASRPTGYLRYLCGHGRFMLHDIQGAKLEYDEALRIGVADPLRQQVEPARDRAAEEIARLGRAEAVTARNGWVAAAALALLSVSCWAALRCTRPGADHKMSRMPLT